jgi:hypothetical protein
MRQMLYPVAGSNVVRCTLCASSASVLELSDCVQWRQMCYLPCCCCYAVLVLIHFLQSGGTRGDVQPATALGVALAGLGARVCVAADAMFDSFVQQQGLAYYQLAGDARGMMALTVKWG